MISLMGIGRGLRIPTQKGLTGISRAWPLRWARCACGGKRAPRMRPACASAHEKPKTRRLPSSCPDLFLSSPA